MPPFIILIHIPPINKQIRNAAKCFFVVEEEKQFVRSTAMAVLLQDPSDRVSTQAALLITNIARFDFPRPWPSLLPDLVSAAAMESHVPLQAKSRALMALKFVLRALRSKRFIIEPVPGTTIQSSDGKFCGILCYSLAAPEQNTKMKK